jgi:hypothetical protein
MDSLSHAHFSISSEMVVTARQMVAEPRRTPFTHPTGIKSNISLTSRNAGLR